MMRTKKQIFNALNDDFKSKYLCGNMLANRTEFLFNKLAEQEYRLQILEGHNSDNQTDTDKYIDEIWEKCKK